MLAMIEYNSFAETLNMYAQEHRDVEIILLKQCVSVLSYNL